MTHTHTHKKGVSEPVHPHAFLHHHHLHHLPPPHALLDVACCPVFIQPCHQTMFCPVLMVARGVLSGQQARRAQQTATKIQIPPLDTTLGTTACSHETQYWSAVFDLIVILFQQKKKKRIVFNYKNKGVFVKACNML